MRRSNHYFTITDVRREADIQEFVAWLKKRAASEAFKSAEVDVRDGAVASDRRVHDGGEVGA
jgi:hypothetical protein